MPRKSTKTTETVKSVRSVRSAAKAMTKTVPDLRPTDNDSSYFGAEPEFHVLPENRNIAVIRAFNWYSRFFEQRHARDMLMEFAVQQGMKSEADRLKKVDDNQIVTTFGWLARMSFRGLELTEQEKTRIQQEIQRLVSTVKIEKTETAPRRVVNVQEIMREKAAEAAGELEHQLDEFIQSGARSAEISVDTLSHFTSRNVLPQHVSPITEQWRRRRQEFEQALTDAELAEGYDNFTKTQLKSLVKFSDAVISGLGSYVTVKKANRAPRRRKAVSPEKQASKVKYLREFQELSLTSVPPSRIVGASEVWAYDTAKRKLWYFVADSHSQTLTIKGTSILGYDTVSSGMKTLRKPAEQIAELMAAGKPAARKWFKNLRSVQAQLKGRTNENLVILRVW